MITMAHIQTFLMVVFLIIVVECIEGIPPELPQAFEAAFQGQCGHGSPCEQLCYELHDGMYECDCVEGYELHKNGYSCMELNSTVPSHLENEIDDGRDILYQKDASFSAELDISLDISASVSPDQQFDIANDVTTQGPSLEQKVPRSSPRSESTASITVSTSTTAAPCLLECRAGGICVEDKHEQRCQCPLGKSGTLCEEDVTIHTPRFTGSGWVAFPALRAAYKHVQVDLEIRPEAYDGIFFLTGERDDMGGDFMVMLLHQGFVEFRFDCGSGLGVVRSEQTVLLNKWNRVTLYRHRWDAWIQLNDGKRVQGRSKGLFSRITFREPLFIGGAGNTTRLLDKLPVADGFRGCVRRLTVNEHEYRFGIPIVTNVTVDSVIPMLTPVDVFKGFDIEECTADRCLWAPCQHGGKCLVAEGGGDAQCLCPLGFSGDLCETRLDLQVPAFNGSSHLRFPGLGDACSSWLELQLTIKPHTGDGILLYNSQGLELSEGNGELGDFIALYLSTGYVGFAFDLGSGTAVVRSEQPLSMDEWHTVRLSRSGRLASLRVDDVPPTDVLTPGSSAHLSLPRDLHIGGVPDPMLLPHLLRDKGSFDGCIQKVVINDRPINVLAEALGGSNVDNCPHPCITNPCGPDGRCVPNMDYFTCECNTVSSGSRCQEAEVMQIEPMVPVSVHANSGVKFTGTNSYMHYSDEETMKRIVTYVIDINLRFRTTSPNGLILWSGRHRPGVGQEYLALGLIDGHLHLHYNLGDGNINMSYNRTRVADGLWHRLRALRSTQEGLLEVDGGEPVRHKSTDKLRLLNADSGLYIGGMPDIWRSTGLRYRAGFAGCISELVLGGQFEVSLKHKRGSARNVESCAT